MKRKQVLINIFLIFVVVIFTSCSKTLTPKTTYIYKDSTITTYNYKDTLVYIKKDSVVIDSIRVRVDSDGKAQLEPIKVKSNNAYAKVGIKNNILTLEGGCDSLEVKLKQLTIENSRLQSTTNEVIQIVEKAYIPKFYKFCTYAFILLVCVSIVYIYLRLKGLPKL